MRHSQARTARARKRIRDKVRMALRNLGGEPENEVVMHALRVNGDAVTLRMVREAREEIGRKRKG